MPRASANRVNKEGYHYHVFLSYRHLSKVEEWVREHFKDELTAWLREWLGGDEPVLFWDRQDIRPGAKWPQRLANSIHTSCCLVPIWAPSYFQSSWCRAELETFLKREEIIENLGDYGLIVPIIWHEIPEQPYKIEPKNFTEYTWTGNGFKDSRLYPDFQRQVREFARDVANAVLRAPAFSPDWPVVTPEEIEIRDGDTERQPVKIPRPLLRKSTNGT